MTFWNGQRESDNQPLKSCVVFDNGASARAAKRLLKRIAPDDTLETTLLRLEEDLLPANGKISANAAVGSELLVFAIARNAEPRITLTGCEHPGLSGNGDFTSNFQDR